MPSLLEIPAELRYRIYNFMFQDLKYVFSGSRPWSRFEPPPQSVILKCLDFPIRLTETCHLLHDEVFDCIAHHSKAAMTIDTENQQFAIQAFIPGRFRARVTHLDTNYTVMEQNLLFNTEFLPALQSLSVHLGTTLVQAVLENSMDFCRGDKTTKHRNVNRYVAQCFADFHGCKTLVKYCRQYNINSSICFRACFAFNNYVQEIHDVELRNDCGQEQELRVTREKFDFLKEIDELNRGEVFTYGDVYLVRTSLLKHAKLLQEVVPGTPRRRPRG